MILIRITAPHFCAGMLISSKVTRRYAPILHYMKDWSVEEIKKYCTKKNWKCEISRYCLETEEYYEQVFKETL